MTRLFLLATLAGAVMTGCSREAEAPGDGGATTVDQAGNGLAGDASDAIQNVQLTGGDGSALGSASVSDGAAGLTIKVEITGMRAGTHGIHLHEKGLCDGPRFESAGAHWNPAAKQHGRDNPQGAHLGDLANLEVSALGVASSKVTIPGAAIRAGGTPLADGDGTSIIVHAKADDYKTDPSGDSGDRIACAVVATAE